ncbi:MAG: type II toxin-antitoxin system Phd/YefM family antitoxin [Candidatus Daviesbacteria bacterium]|nr:type II toxin-antitoxin system Phd/YefM family antitoxin [Candidatus Daviesbacteria bacterium]
MLNNSIVSIDELRSNLADIISRVMYAKEKIVVRKYNRDAAVMISPDEYEKLMDPTKRLSDRQWKTSFKRLDKIRAKIPRINPQKLDRIIDEAVAEVRAERAAAGG